MIEPREDILAPNTSKESSLEFSTSPDTVTHNNVYEVPEERGQEKSVELECSERTSNDDGLPLVLVDKPKDVNPVSPLSMLPPPPKNKNMELGGVQKEIGYIRPDWSGKPNPEEFPYIIEVFELC
jgi:hypothetical protein